MRTPLHQTHLISIFSYNSIFFFVFQLLLLLVSFISVSSRYMISFCLPKWILAQTESNLVLMMAEPSPAYTYRHLTYLFRIIIITHRLVIINGFTHCILDSIRSKSLLKFNWRYYYYYYFFLLVVNGRIRLCVWRLHFHVQLKLFSRHFILWYQLIWHDICSVALSN